MTKQVFQLGHWRYDQESGVLQDKGVQVSLEPLCQLILEQFLQSPFEVISISELADKVWLDRYVSDDTVRRTVSRLRAALGEKAYKPQFIETIPKRGFRLILQPHLRSNIPQNINLQRVIPRI